MIVLPLVLLFGIASTAPTTEPVVNDRTIAVPSRGALHLSVPADWKESTDAAPPTTGPSGPPTKQFIDPSGKFEMLISVVSPAARQDAKSFNALPRLKSIVQSQGEELLKTAKETSLDPQEIKGSQSWGYVYTLTDKSPAPRSFEYMSGGLIGTGDLILSVTMLMHEKNPPARETALTMLKSAHQDARQTLSVSLADKNWQVSVDAPGLQEIRDETSPDKHARQLTAANPDAGVNVSIFLEPAATIGDAKTARQFYFDRLKHSPLLMRDDKFTDGPNGSARADYVLPDLDQHHVNLYFAKEGVWIDVHISFDAPKPAQPPDHPAIAIEDIVKSVRVEPRK